MIDMERRPKKEEDVPAKAALALVLSAASIGVVLFGINISGSEDDRRLPLVSPSGRSSPYTPVTPASLAPHPLALTNISDHAIDISDNPNAWTPKNNRGSLAVGETAMASCVVANMAYPQGTLLYITATAEGGERKGYISVYPEASVGVTLSLPDTDRPPQISATLADIYEAHLPGC